MRTAKDICLLCNVRESNQLNSHIIPKFFGKGLFYDTKPRHSLSFDKTGKRQKVQDILKENYLLCPECEKGISIFETYCIHRLDKYNNIRHFNKFRKFQYDNFKYFESKEIDIRIYNLFIYSIVWRISVSQSDAFGAFKLPEIEEETLRAIINKYITHCQADLDEKIEDLLELPDHHHVVVRPERQLRPPNSMLSAASISESLHEIHLVDYILFYKTNSESFEGSLESLNNNNLRNRVKIGLLPIEDWRFYNYKTTKEALNQMIHKS